MFRKSVCFAAGFVVVGLIGGGCATNNAAARKPATPANSAVTHLSPPVLASAPQPVIVQPVQPIQPVLPVPVQPVAGEPQPVVASAQQSPASSTASAGGTGYTVQKGDTLSKIARNKYGNVNAVRKIKEANPGIDYNNIKAGQKIMLP
jgi:nucleoid-associated protein YgaU